MPTTLDIRKTQSHGRIGEAVVTAKCWMNGIPAHNTNGLRANFAGSDLIVDTPNPRRKLLIQVKTGYCPTKNQVYLTQAAGDGDLTEDKFKADFVVFVNMDKKAGESHKHDGTLKFEHLKFYVLPEAAANAIYKAAVKREYDRPLLKSPERRKLTNMAVHVPAEDMEQYQDAWHLISAPASYA